MKKEMRRKCPYCLGRGTVGAKVIGYPAKKRMQARQMFKAGVGLRTIGRVLGINHPQKVKAMINAKTR